MHALDHTGLVDPTITFFSARRDGVLLGIGALKRLDEGHGEIKSMHTSAPARAVGIGLAVLHHLLAVARDRGYRRVSLETGTMAEFAGARRLYLQAGFAVCPPFAQYTDNPYSTCMTIELTAPAL